MPITPKKQPPYYTPSRRYKQYTALLTQTSTDNPIATVLKNTYNDTPIWTRNDVGYYLATITTNEFTIGKTTVIVTGSDNKTGYAEITAYGNYDDNFIEILQALYSNAAPEDGFKNVTIEIKTYV